MQVPQPVSIFGKKYIQGQHSSRIVGHLALPWNSLLPAFFGFSDNEGQIAAASREKELLNCATVCFSLTVGRLVLSDLAAKTGAF